MISKNFYKWHGKRQIKDRKESKITLSETIPTMRLLFLRKLFTSKTKELKNYFEGDRITTRKEKQTNVVFKTGKDYI